ncbi:MAG: MarR family winged helix-turn-helix transcriptional regulator, partial [Armatimonadota bacterium]
KDHQGASLSRVAAHLGATLSAASRIVDHLVDRGYVRRQTAERDRRRLILELTDSGEDAVNSVKLRMHSCLAEKLTALTPGECSVLEVAMDILRSALVSAQDREDKHSAGPCRSGQRNASDLPARRHADQNDDTRCKDQLLPQGDVDS